MVKLNMFLNYQRVKFRRLNQSNWEHGVYLTACTNQDGSYLAQRVVVIKTNTHGGVAEVIQVGNLLEVI